MNFRELFCASIFSVTDHDHNTSYLYIYIFMKIYAIKHIPKVCCKYYQLLLDKEK